MPTSAPMVLSLQVAVSFLVLQWCSPQRSLVLLDALDREHSPKLTSLLHCVAPPFHCQCLAVRMVNLVATCCWGATAAEVLLVLACEHLQLVLCATDCFALEKLAATWLLQHHLTPQVGPLGSIETKDRPELAYLAARTLRPFPFRQAHVTAGQSGPEPVSSLIPHIPSWHVGRCAEHGPRTRERA